MVCSRLLCGYFPIRCDFSDFFHSRLSTLKERTRPNTLNLDSPPNEAKNSRLKYPHGQNSTAESNCKGLTFILTFYPRNRIPASKARRQFVSPIKEYVGREPCTNPARHNERSNRLGNLVILPNEDSQGTRTQFVNKNFCCHPGSPQVESTIPHCLNRPIKIAPCRVYKF